MTQMISGDWAVFIAFGLPISLLMWAALIFFVREMLR